MQFVAILSMTVLKNMRVLHIIAHRRKLSFLYKNLIFKILKISKFECKFERQNCKMLWLSRMPPKVLNSSIRIRFFLFRVYSFVVAQSRLWRISFKKLWRRRRQRKKNNLRDQTTEVYWNGSSLQDLSD